MDHPIFAQTAQVLGLPNQNVARRLVGAVLAQLREVVAPIDVNYLRAQLPLALQELFGPELADPFASERTLARLEAEEFLRHVSEAANLPDGRELGRKVQAVFYLLGALLPASGEVLLVQSMAVSLRELWLGRDQALLACR